MYTTIATDLQQSFAASVPNAEKKIAQFSFPHPHGIFAPAPLAPPTTASIVANTPIANDNNTIITTFLQACGVVVPAAADGSGGGGDSRWALPSFAASSLPSYSSFPRRFYKGGCPRRRHRDHYGPRPPPPSSSASSSTASLIPLIMSAILFVCLPFCGTAPAVGGSSLVGTGYWPLTMAAAAVTTTTAATTLAPSYATCGVDAPYDAVLNACVGIGDVGCYQKYFMYFYPVPSLYLAAYQKCVVPQTCTGSTILDTSTNRCVDTNNQPVSTRATQPTTTRDPSITSAPIVRGYANCQNATRGHWDNATAKCICADGWRTDVYQDTLSSDPATYRWCDVADLGPIDYNSTTTDLNFFVKIFQDLYDMIIGKGSPTLTAIITVVVFIGSGLSTAFSVFCCIRKYRQKQLRRRVLEIDSDGNNPNDSDYAERRREAKERKIRMKKRRAAAAARSAALRRRAAKLFGKGDDAEGDETENGEDGGDAPFAIDMGFGSDDHDEDDDDNSEDDDVMGSRRRKTAALRRRKRRLSTFSRQIALQQKEFQAQQQNQLALITATVAAVANAGGGASAQPPAAICDKKSKRAKKGTAKRKRKGAKREDVIVSSTSSLSTSSTSDLVISSVSDSNASEAGAFPIAMIRDRRRSRRKELSKKKRTAAANRRSSDEDDANIREEYRRQNAVLDVVKMMMAGGAFLPPLQNQQQHNQQFDSSPAAAMANRNSAFSAVGLVPHNQNRRGAAYARQPSPRAAAAVEILESEDDDDFEAIVSQGDCNNYNDEYTAAMEDLRLRKEQIAVERAELRLQKDAMMLEWNEGGRSFGRGGGGVSGRSHVNVSPSRDFNNSPTTTGRQQRAVSPASFTPCLTPRPQSYYQNYHLGNTTDSHFDNNVSFSAGLSRTTSQQSLRQGGGLQHQQQHRSNANAFRSPSPPRSPAAPPLPQFKGISIDADCGIVASPPRPSRSSEASPLRGGVFDSASPKRRGEKRRGDVAEEEGGHHGHCDDKTPHRRVGAGRSNANISPSKRDSATSPTAQKAVYHIANNSNEPFACDEDDGDYGNRRADLNVTPRRRSTQQRGTTLSIAQQYVMPAEDEEGDNGRQEPRKVKDASRPKRKLPSFASGSFIAPAAAATASSNNGINASTTSSARRREEEQFERLQKLQQDHFRQKQQREPAFGSNSPRSSSRAAISNEPFFG